MTLGVVPYRTLQRKFQGYAFSIVNLMAVNILYSFSPSCCTELTDDNAMAHSQEMVRLGYPFGLDLMMGRY